MSATTTADTEYTAWLAEQAARKAYRPTVGAIVRLHDDVGSGPKRAQTWRVTAAPTRSTAVRYTIEPVGGGRGLRVLPEQIKPADAATAAAAQVVPILEPIHPGTVVRYANAPQPQVVVAENADGSLRLFPLGGGTRYYKSAARAACRVVTATVTD